MLKLIMFFKNLFKKPCKHELRKQLTCSMESNAKTLRKDIVKFCQVRLKEK